MDQNTMNTALQRYNMTDAAIEQMKAEYLPLTVGGLEDKAGLKLVHEARMVVKGKRIDVEKTRKALKEDALRFGQAVDAEAKRITALLAPIEEHLQDEEDKIAQIRAEIEAQKKAEEEARLRAVEEAERRAAEAEARLAREIADRHRAAEIRLQEAENDVLISESTRDKAVAAAQARIDKLDGLLKYNQDLLGREAEVRAAVARADELDRELADLRAQHGAALLALREAEAAREAAVDAKGRALNVIKIQAVERARSASRRLVDREAVENAVRDLEVVRGRLGAMVSEADGLAREVRAMQDRLFGGKDSRITALRCVLEQVAQLGHVDNMWDKAPATAEKLGALASDGLRADDSAAAEYDALPERIAEAQERQQLLADSVVKARTHLQNTERLAARLPEIKAAVADLEAATREEQAAVADGERASCQIQIESARVETLRAAWEQMKAQNQRIRSDRDALAPLFALVPRLDQARARIEELELELQIAGADLVSIREACVEQVAQFRVRLETARAEFEASPMATADTPAKGGVSA